LPNSRFVSWKYDNLIKKLINLILKDKIKKLIKKQIKKEKNQITVVMNNVSIVKLPLLVYS
jgi:hypothetical protein